MMIVVAPFLLVKHAFQIWVNPPLLAWAMLLVIAAGVATETAVVLVLFGMWQLAGSFVLLGPEGAIDRGKWIWRVERAVHLPSEAVIQQAFLPHPLIVQALNLYYAGLHFVVVIGCLIWVYVWHRRQYPQVRTTLVLFTAAALLVQFIPVAPPRMLPGDGMIDTALRYGQSVYGSVAGFNADQLSAMPSVHVGWAMLTALVIIEVSRSRWRWLALAYPMLTMLAVVVTANHYWLDGIAAALLLALALVVQRVSRMLYWRCRARRRDDQPEDLLTLVFTPASTSSARWQATSRPGRTSRSVGTSVAQRSMASGQRG